MKSARPAFPPMQTAPSDDCRFPIHVALASAVRLAVRYLADVETRFVSDMRDPVETSSVLPVIHETIAQIHDQPRMQHEVTQGEVLVNLDFECEGIPPLLCFPMGRVGEQLSE